MTKDKFWLNLDKYLSVLMPNLATLCKGKYDEKS